MAVARYDSMNVALTDGMTDGRVFKKANPDRGGVVEQTTARSRVDRLGYEFGVVSGDEDCCKTEAYNQRPDLAHTLPEQHFLPGY